MAFVQRSFGKLLKRSADDADVATLITDVKSYDDRLDKLIADLKKWQESITTLLTHQNALSQEMVTLYKPIPTERVALDKARLARIEEYCNMAKEMKEELSNEATKVGNVLKQTTAVKTSLKPVKKMLEKRENSKLDYERYNSNMESARKKGSRSEREMGVQAKAERQLEQATSVYHALDEHIKLTVPPVLDAIAAYIPFVLYAIDNITTTFIGGNYRHMHEFAERHELLNYDNFQHEWKQDFMPVKEHVEQLRLLQSGKAVHKPMESHAAPASPESSRKPSFLGRRQSSKTGEELTTSSPLSRVRTNEMPPSYSENDPMGGRPMSRQQSIGSGFGIGEKAAPPRPVSRKSSGNIWSKDKATETSIRPAAQKIQSSTSIKSFQTETPAAASSTTSLGMNGLASKKSSASLASAAAAAAKKKAPPPPVPKSKPQLPKPRDVYMVALYDFEPQSDGDLGLREGCRVRVIKKTENVEDWWEGEVVQPDGRVLKGYFPANYCQME